MQGARVQLRSGQVIDAGHGGGELWLAVDHEKLRWPSWRGGVGGLELVVSPDERLAVLFIFSGQSSQGYELFSLRPLRRLEGLAEVHGHGSAPQFSPDSAWLVSLIDQPPRLRASGEYFEERQADDSSERAIIDVATLYVQPLAPVVGAPQRQPVGLELPLSTDLDWLQEWDCFGALVFRAGLVEVRLPGGALVATALPPTGPLTVRP